MIYMLHPLFADDTNIFYKNTSLNTSLNALEVDLKILAAHPLASPSALSPILRSFVAMNAAFF